MSLILLALAGAAPAPAVPTVSPAAVETRAQLPRPDAILAQVRRVADWQLANRTNWATMPAARKSVQNPRDWQQATFWIALTELAKRDARYAPPLMELRRGNSATIPFTPMIN
jgi:hypothetical protein